MTTTNPFDAPPILEGIRRWVEIETPTEAPGQVNKDPYAAWLFRIKPAGGARADNLMDAEAYRKRFSET